MLRRILAIAMKELKVLGRDLGTLAILLLLPLALASLFGSLGGPSTGAGEGESAEEQTIVLPLAVVNLDQGRYGLQVLETLTDIPVLEILPAADQAQAGELVVDGDAIAAVVIPAGFTADMDSYTPSTVQVLGDPTQQRIVSIVEGVLAQALMQVWVESEMRHGIASVMERIPALASAEAEARDAAVAVALSAVMPPLEEAMRSPWLSVEAVDQEGEEASMAGSAFDYTFPMLTVMFVFFISSPLAAALWREKEQGSMRRVIASPATRREIAAGTILAYTLAVCLQVVVLFTVGHLVFHARLGHSLLGLALVTVALGLTASALGVLVAAYTGSASQADSVGTILGFVLAAVGGCIAYPIFLLGGVLGFISRLTPHAHGVEAYFTLIDGGEVMTVLPHVAILLLMAAAMFIVATRRFRFV